MAFVADIYRITDHYPSTEKYALANQMRRAAVSIPSNIAEGYGRSSMSDLLHFLYFALGSSNEIETQIVLSKDLGFINDEEYKSLDAQITDIYKMLSSLIYKKKHETAQPTVQP